MKQLKKIKKQPAKEQNSSFADFFLNASDKEKIQVFEIAAKKANKEQRKLIENLNRLQHETT